MATNTYVAIQSATVSGSSTGVVTFANIPQTYTDLIIVSSVTYSADGYINQLRFNDDSNTNYSYTRITGNGSTAASSSLPNINYAFGGWSGTVPTTNIIQIMNYSNSTTHKTVLTRTNLTTDRVVAYANLWRSTNAITKITLTQEASTNYTSGTWTLYGIAAEGTNPAPKATGGVLYSDSTYYYHVFGSTGTFTPLQSISADILVVAGGGGGAGGGDEPSGGGGAGGLLTFTSQSLTATGYTCTVGGGGTAGGYSFKGSDGGASQFGALTAAAGGGAGGWKNGAGGIGNAGGSGGGGSGWASPSQRSGGQASPSGQGNAGGAGTTGGVPYGSGGGGGAGAVGQDANTGSTGGGNGGIGATSTFINAIGAATGAGQYVSNNYYFAGGGGGGSFGSGARAGLGGYGGGGAGVAVDTTTGTPGTANTGGGAGASAGNISGAAGGSGIIVVRYAKV